MLKGEHIHYFAPLVSSDGTVIHGTSLKLVTGPSKFLEALIPSSDLAHVNMFARERPLHTRCHRIKKIASSVTRESNDTKVETTEASPTDIVLPTTTHTWTQC